MSSSSKQIQNAINPNHREMQRKSDRWKGSSDSGAMVIYIIPLTSTTNNGRRN
jgi:hypothetical protein